jgi:hypothetical protein
MAACIFLLIVLLAFGLVMLAPMMRWVQKRRINARVHSVHLRKALTYQAQLNAKRKGLHLRLVVLAVVLATGSVPVATAESSTPFTTASLASSRPVPVTIDSGYDLDGVACPSTRQCTAISGAGSGMNDAGEVTFNPTAPGHPSPRTIDFDVTIGLDNILAGVACPSTSQCTAVDGQGNEVTFNPTSPGSPTPTLIDSKILGLALVACPSTSRCTAIDYDGNEVTFDPTSPRVASPRPIRPPPRSTDYIPYGIACPSTRQCTVVFSDRKEVTFDPVSPGRPNLKLIDRNAVPGGVSCPLPRQCTVVDSSGNELTFNPNSRGVPTPKPVGSPGLVGVACPSASQCTAVDSGGGEVTFEPRSPGVPNPTLVAHHILTAVACPSKSECTTVGFDGQEVTFDPITVAPAKSGILNGPVTLNVTGPTVHGYKTSLSGSFGGGDSVLSFVVDKQPARVGETDSWVVKLAPGEVRINGSKDSITARVPLGSGGGFDFTFSGRPQAVHLSCGAKYNEVKGTLKGTLRINTGDNFFKTVSITRMTGWAAGTIPSCPAPCGRPEIASVGVRFGPGSADSDILGAQTQDGKQLPNVYVNVTEMPAGSPFDEITHVLFFQGPKPLLRENPNLTTAQVSTPGGALSGRLSFKASGALHKIPSGCKGVHDDEIFRDSLVKVTTGKITATFDSIGKVTLDSNTMNRMIGRQSATTGEISRVP